MGNGALCNQRFSLLTKEHQETVKCKFRDILKEESIYQLRIYVLSVPPDQSLVELEVTIPATNPYNNKHIRQPFHTVQDVVQFLREVTDRKFIINGKKYDTISKDHMYLIVHFVY